MHIDRRRPLVKFLRWSDESAGDDAEQSRSSQSSRDDRDPEVTSATEGRRPGRMVLIRKLGAGGSHQVLDWLTAQRLSAVGGVRAAREHRAAARPAAQGGGLAGRLRQRREPPGEGPWVAEVTGLLDPSG